VPSSRRPRRRHSMQTLEPWTRQSTSSVRSSARSRWRRTKFSLTWSSPRTCSPAGPGLSSLVSGIEAGHDGLQVTVVDRGDPVFDHRTRIRAPCSSLTAEPYQCGASADLPPPYASPVSRAEWSSRLLLQRHGEPVKAPEIRRRPLSGRTSRLDGELHRWKSGGGRESNPPGSFRPLTGFEGSRAPPRLESASDQRFYLSPPSSERSKTCALHGPPEDSSGGRWVSFLWHHLPRNDLRLPPMYIPQTDVVRKGGLEPGDNVHRTFRSVGNVPLVPEAQGQDTIR